MIRFSLAALFTLALCACSFSGCFKNHPSAAAAQLRLAVPSEPPQLDTRKMKDMISGSLARMFSEGLMRHNSEGDLAPGLAQSYELDSSRTCYTFELRPSLHWSDGSSLTAYDFEYSWKRILDPHFLSEYASALFIIKNARAAKEGKLPLQQVAIRALDEQHLQVELERPVAHFPEMLAFYTFYPVPKGIDEKTPHWAEQVDRHFLSCGPFMLCEWKHNRELRLRKNPHYWDQKSVQIETIQLSVIQDEHTALNLFEQGELDFIGTPFSTLPIDAIPQWKERPMLQSRPVAFSLWYKINTTLPLLRNEKIRSALSLAIDRQSIARNVAQNTLIPATSFLPPSLQLNRDLIPIHAMREKAQRLLVEGLHEEGIDWSELPRLHLSFNDTQLNRRIAQAVQQQWKDHLGLEVALESLEWKSYLSKLHKMNYEIARLAWSANFHDPMSYLEVFQFADPLQGAHNETGWEDPRYRRLLDEAIASHSRGDYEECLAEAERLLVAACPIIPLLHYKTLWLQAPYLEGSCVNGLGHVDFRWARLDSNRKRGR